MRNTLKFLNDFTSEIQNISMLRNVARGLVTSFFHGQYSELMNKDERDWTKDEKLLAMLIYGKATELRKSLEALCRDLEMKTLKEKIANMIKNDDEDIERLLEDEVIDAEYMEENIAQYIVNGNTRKTLRVNISEKTYMYVGEILFNLEPESDSSPE